MKNKILFIIVIVLFINVVISFRNKTNFSLNEDVSLNDINVDINISLENYVIGVVACEMPASFKDEALKAQAVAARTNALFSSNGVLNYDWVTNVTTQCYIDVDSMKSKWKDDYDVYYQKVYNAVYETAGQVINYDGKLIMAYYFSMSNGYTEDALNVFGNSLDYISVVSSPEDDSIKNFKVDKVISVNEFKNIFNLVDNELDISNISYDLSNRVDSILINGRIYTGVEVRKLLELRSTDFDINISGDDVVITTRGYGHGVGMSQYGANILASEGKKYADILGYYYKNIDIVNFYV